MKIEDNFVPSEIARRLKDLGFDEECLCYIDSDTDNIEFFEYYDCDRTNSTLQSDYGGNKFCTSPMYQQAIWWMLKKLNFYYPMLKFEIFDDESGVWGQTTLDKIEIDFDSLQDALVKALDLFEKHSTNTASTTVM